jgi:hypothetical protein
MPWFLIMIEGGPIDWPREQTSVEQRIDRVGFFTTPKVHANSEQRAITLAIDDALTELRDTMPHSAVAAAAACKVIKVWQPTWLQVVTRRYRGFTFFPEKRLHQA